MKRLSFKIKRNLVHLLSLRSADIRCGYLGGVILLTVSVLIRLLSGSPYRICLLLGNAPFLPRLSLLTFLNLLFSMGIGFACGLILSCRRSSVQCIKYQGGMLFVLLAVFWFASYPLVFRGGMFILTLLTLAAVWILSLGCTLIFTRIQRIAGWILFLFLCWVTYLFLCLLGCILWI